MTKNTELMWLLAILFFLLFLIISVSYQVDGEYYFCKGARGCYNAYATK